MMGTASKAWARGLVLLAWAFGGGALVISRARAQAVVATYPLVTDVVITRAYVGKLVSEQHIAVCPLASGLLEEVDVQEGQAVKQGDVLFKISSLRYQARLEIALSELKVAEIEFETTSKLFDDKVVSPSEVAIASAKRAKAEAQVKLAKTELSFTTVRAPFDGRIGRVSVHPGSLIKEGETLTTLTSDDVLRAYFQVPESQYLDARERQTKDKPQVELVHGRGVKFPSLGNLIAVECDPQTGAIVFRADFSNPGHLLLHGQTANVLVHHSLPKALVIPPQSTFTINDKRYVYTVDRDNIVHQREVTIQNAQDDYFVVKTGVDSKDRILVEGIRKIRDGEKVEYEFRQPEEVLPKVKRAAAK
jgi:membrane fusion protein (multidrug efflux system)